MGFSRPQEAAAAIIAIATENMVQAIVDITVNQGIDPRDAILIGGGGAAGLNSTAIARRLGSGRVVIPEVGAALSARCSAAKHNSIPTRPHYPRAVRRDQGWDSVPVRRALVETNMPARPRHHRRKFYYYIKLEDEEPREVAGGPSNDGPPARLGQRPQTRTET